MTAYIRNGREVTREEFDATARRWPPKKHGRKATAAVPMIGDSYGEGNPGKSIGMSVHPSQIPMMNEAIKRHGIRGVSYDPSKRDNCVITSRRGRAKWMPIFAQMTRLTGLHDDDGGYGDG